jgi:hypothetical protein
MTSSDIESSTRSTIDIKKICLLLGNICVKLEDSSTTITSDIKHNVKLGKWPLVTLKVGLGHPKSNQVITIDHKMFLPNYIKIRSVVSPKSRSQEIYSASANASSAGGFKKVNPYSPHYVWAN